MSETNQPRPMTSAEMVAMVRAQGKTEKPTKGLTEWTRNATLAEAMGAMGFTVVYVAEPTNGTSAPYWRLNCNGNRFRAIVKLLRDAGAQV